MTDAGVPHPLEARARASSRFAARFVRTVVPGHRSADGTAQEALSSTGVPARAIVALASVARAVLAGVTAPLEHAQVDRLDLEQGPPRPRSPPRCRRTASGRAASATRVSAITA